MDMTTPQQKQPLATAPQRAPDGFVSVARTPANIDRWIVRCSIRNALCAVFPRLRGRLLDVGCGRMPYRTVILENTAVVDYLGLDIADALPYDTAVPADVHWDGVTMPFADESFDCVIATEVFEHTPDLDRLLVEVYRVLKPGGVLFFTTPFLWPYHEVPRDMQRWTAFGVEHRLTCAAFCHIDVTSVGNWHSALAQFLGLWVARAPMPRALRWGLRYPLFLLQLCLSRFDGDSAPDESSMPRLLTGTAEKPSPMETASCSS